MSSFSKWDRDAYRSRVGAQEAARRRGAIMAEQWGYQLAEQRKRPWGSPRRGWRRSWASRPAGCRGLSTARFRQSRLLPGTSPRWAENWNWSPTSAATCSRCLPTRRPDLHRNRKSRQPYMTISRRGVWHVCGTRQTRRLLVTYCVNNALVI